MSSRVAFSIPSKGVAISKRYVQPVVPVKVAQTSIRKTSVLASEWVENFIHIKNADTFAVEQMDLTQRKYLRRLYDTPSRKILFMTSRQTEKTIAFTDLVSMHDGSLREAGDIRVGDQVATMLPGGKMGTGKVTWVSRRYAKPAMHVTTRQGHVFTAGVEHPFRTWEAWIKAEELEVGTRLAAVRQCGEFTGSADMPDERIRLTAYLIGDGGLSGRAINFTKGAQPLVDEFCWDVQAIGGTYRRHARGNVECVHVHEGTALRRWLTEDNLMGKKSADKTIPPWVFGLSRKKTALFLNRLWATDGHVSQRTRSNYNIVYASMSKRLVEQVQALMWKFGIPTRIRKNWPNTYKRRGEEKFAYLLNVETKEGIVRFLRDVGAFNKSEGVPLPEEDSNNNLDTFPIEIQDLITEIIDTAAIPLKQSMLFTQGLHRTLKYAPTWDKIGEYVSTFRADERYPQELVDRLEEYIRSDLYWDRVKTVAPAGDVECVDFTVEGTHNFVTAGMITHNSTTLGNRFLTRMATKENYPSLFVTPSAMQTMTFSRARLDDIIEVSPLLRELSGVSNLLEKRFKNGSVGYLRYAFLNADRIRGISAVDLYADEIQDLLPDVMPVIEEVTSHHQDPHLVYSGTPKTFDNTIEKYWNLSTQSEWAIPCEHHGVPGDPSSWYWNVLDLKNIGKTGPICSRCGNAIRPDHPKATWVVMQPHASDAEITERREAIARGEDVEDEVSRFEGLRICRLMVPWYIHSPKRWKELLYQLETYPQDKFQNEVLARSFDGGQKPLSRAEIIRVCDDTYVNTEEAALKWRGAATLFAGIDWGTGSENSYTVLSIGGYVRKDHSFQVIYSRRFDGPLADPGPQVQEILRLIALFRCRLVGSDYGFGFVQNKQLTSALGAARVLQHQYQHKLTAKVAYRPHMHRFLVFRTPVMSDIIYAIKTKKIRLPSWASYAKPYAEDFTALRAEYSNTQRMIMYGKPSNATDDTFHSVLYAMLASYRVHPRPDIIAPIKDATDEQSRAAIMEEAAIEQLYRDAGLYGIDV